ncbi:MAG: hypothetical protein JNM29_17930 [Candidatus Odyssella sp.]|nr:hypothetical protein [Candidatus Odyssella sp.]
MRRTALLAATAALAVPPAAHAQDIVLVQHVTNVTLARAGGAILVTAGGTVPIAGFTNPLMRPRPDLVKVEGGYVLDFVATPPPRGTIVAQVETRIVVTFRIEPEEAEKLRFVQVRAALASRTVQVPAK